MPAETLITVTAIVAVFAFFGGIVAFADLTWDRNKR